MASRPLLTAAAIEPLSVGEIRTIQAAKECCAAAEAYAVLSLGSAPADSVWGAASADWDLDGQGGAYNCFQIYDLTTYAQLKSFEIIGPTPRMPPPLIT